MILVGLVVSLGAASLAVAASQGFGNRKVSNQFTAVLNGHNEVPATHSAAQGRLTLTVNADNTMAFELTYSGLANAATAAHVHFGQPLVNGAVSFFFCGGGGKAACPAGTAAAGPATVTGTITAADVAAIPSQLLPAGDLAAIVDEIRDGFAYANIHSAVSPGGEIRGQLGPSHQGKGHDDDHDHDRDGDHDHNGGHDD
jgi:hypothetical protein